MIFTAKALRISALVALTIMLAWIPAGGAEQGHHYLPPRPTVSPGHLSPDELAITKAFERVDPAVVVLLTEESEISEEDGELVLRPSRGIGSGVVISEVGKILTAAHVVSGTRNLKVRLLDGSEVGASIIFSDTASDIAVVRMNPGYPPTPHAVLGDSDSVQVGQTALVIGAPLGAERSLSVGHISARRNGKEFFGGAITAEMLQTDAAVNHGNSGGPLVNLAGEVIGVISRILTTAGGSQGLGFAISSNNVKQLLGADPAPWIGLNTLFIGPEIARALHIPSEGALLVQSIAEDSPAERAGIRGGDLPAHLGDTKLVLGGDVVLAIEDQRTCHAECIAHEIHDQALASTMKLTLWREGREVLMEIPVERPHILAPAVQLEKPVQGKT
jgi:serine protease Do